MKAASSLTVAKGVWQRISSVSKSVAVGRRRIEPASNSFPTSSNRLVAQRNSPTDSPTFAVTAATSLGLTCSVQRNLHNV